MKYLSVFSGIEAATVAWKPLGWRAVALAEIEKFPCAVLKHHYPDIPNRGDVTKYHDWPTETVDVVIGGSPCQAFSVAGLRKGLDDPRGNLTLIYLGIVAKYRPAWVVWENVPGVLSIDEGRVFGAFLGGLAKCGYGFAWRICDAQYSGVPQRRRRVWVVGHLGDWRGAAAVLFDAASLRGDPAPSREAREGLTPTIKSGPTSSRGHGKQSGQDEMICASLRGEGFDASEDGTGRGTPPIAAALPMVFGFSNVSDGSSARNATDLSAPLTLRHGDPGMVCGAVSAKWSKGTGGAAGDECYNLVAFNIQHNDGGKHKRKDRPSGGMYVQETDTALTVGTSDMTAVAQIQAVRRLTPQECERLMAFPDDYTQIPWRGKPAEQCPDGPRYKALGNSMVVNEVRWIGERIQAVTEILETKLRTAG